MKAIYFICLILLSSTSCENSIEKKLIKKSQNTKENIDSNLKQFLHSSKYNFIKESTFFEGKIFSIKKVELNNKDFYSDFKPIRNLDSTDLKLMHYVLKNDSSFKNINTSDQSILLNPIASISLTNDNDKNVIDIIIEHDFSKIEISDLNGSQTLYLNEDISKYLKYILNK